MVRVKILRCLLIGTFILSLAMVILQLSVKQTWNFSYFQRDVIGLQITGNPLTNEKRRDKKRDVQNLNYMSETAWNGVYMVLGCIISALLGIWAFERQRKKTAHDEFEIFIQLKIGEIKSEGFSSLRFYHGTKNEIRDAVFRISPFLNKNRLKRLHTEWNKYSQKKNSELSKFASRIAESGDIDEVENLLKSMQRFLDSIK